MARRPQVVSPGQLEFARIVVKVTPSKSRGSLVDENLKTLCELSKPGEAFTREQIASFIGRSEDWVAAVEARAREKFVAECKRRGMLDELHQFLHR